jgi:FtsH-binding integral membrane protein
MNQNITNMDASSSSSQRLDEGLRDYMLSVYNYMVLGLALTGLVAYLVSQSAEFSMMVASTQPILYFVTFGMAIGFGFLINKMSFNVALIYFLGYAFLMGASLSILFYAYDSASIARVFFMTAALFGAMSFYGYRTKTDLTKFSSLLFVGLIAIIVVSLLNAFIFESNGLSMLISIGVIVFSLGVVAYQTRELKEVYYQAPNEALRKIALSGALTLYIAFINIFISLLRLLGSQE